MTIITQFKRKFLLAWVCLAASISFGQEGRWVGSEYGLEEKAFEADGFCVAILEDHGVFVLGPSGTAYYSNARIGLRHNLLSGEFQRTTCGFYRRSFPPEKVEVMPELGKPYLMVGRLVSDRLQLSKMVEPTPENLETVRRVIRKRGLPLNPQPYLPAAVVAAASPSATLVQPERHVPGAALKDPVMRWAVVAVLMAAAAGLLGWRLKRRK